MKRPLIALTAVLAATCVLAKEPGALPAEPKVEHLVTEDDNARIDELRVRGQAQRIVVQPKNSKMKAYEIVTGDGSRDLAPSHGSSRGAAGQRVWNVLNF